ncbi:leucine-rich repeat domain-containing protein [Singulisphaera rosea]
MSSEDTAPVEAPRRRNRWRLKVLLAANVVALGLFVLSRLSPSQAKALGPWVQAMHQAFNPPGEDAMSPAGQRLVADIKALGGQAGVMARTSKFLGLFGGSETFYVQLNGKEISDEDLARLIRTYGDRIQGLDLRNTKVTNEGLRPLSGMTELRYLILGNDDVSGFPDLHWPTSPITDAGLIHLSGLPSLIDLRLNGLPVTDEGIASIGGLINLTSLSLCRTKVQEPGPTWLSKFPRLMALSLDESLVTDEGLVQLAGATTLRSLSLNKLPVTAAALKTLLGLSPGLQQLEINGCGLLDEEVASLKVLNPALKIDRDR